MGCGASTGVVPHGDFYQIQVDQTWELAKKTVERRKGKNVVIKRSGWKTVRIFVSSTFKDFHQERDILVKRVFADLRIWCETRRLHLVECDLRWGVPKDFTTELTLRMCLEEIDRCYEDNIMPFFVNMTSERIGWIPLGNEIPEAVRGEYKWVEGLSVTEMEIMHGAYRKDNPNALFMLRNPKFLDSVPEEFHKLFVEKEGDNMTPYKLQILKKMISERFPKERVVTYDCQYTGYNPDTKMVELTGLDGTFSKSVFEFFKKRISEQYPLPDGKLDPYQQTKEAHEAFMKSRCISVLGRDQILKEIEEYICGVGIDVPLLLVGGAGTGKSSIMAKVADMAVAKALSNTIPGGGRKGWHVFYHFVGAVPGSTELEKALKRLLKETDLADEQNMPKDVDGAAQLCCGALTNPNTRPVIVLMDALNQFDEDTAALLVNWVPRKLAPHIRVILSMIPDTPQHKSLLDRETKPKVLEVTPLDLSSRKLIVEDMLGKYNKKLDDQQMDSLLSKTSSENPLWLSIACEELRVFGQFRQVSDKINRLADGLLELEAQVFERFEHENGGPLLVAAVCLLEASATGLLETELKSILGDEDNLTQKEKSKDGGEKDDSQREKTKNDIGILPAYKWAEIYRALRPFLRPFGDSGEGRLDFYHRSLSKAVRRKYFSTVDGGEDVQKYHWWHSKLADFFETSGNLDRKIEEYPVHLLKLKDSERMKAFLTDWDVFDELYNEEFSAKLSKYWREGCDFETMKVAYMTAVQNLANTENINKDDLCHRYEKVSRILAQNGSFDAADELLKKAMDLEVQHLGSRPDRMVELYHLAASVADERMKMEEFMYRSQLPRMYTIITHFEKSASLRRQMTGTRNQVMLGITLNRMAFYYSGYAIRGGNEDLNAVEAKKKGLESVEEAIKLFKDMDDEHHVADCLTTKGVCFGQACPEQIKAYNEALELTLRLVGEVHHFADRLFLNMAIYYEEMGDYHGAYNLFLRWYNSCKDLYGRQHPKCARCINTLREPMYQRIAMEKGHEVPEPQETTS